MATETVAALREHSAAPGESLKRMERRGTGQGGAVSRAPAETGVVPSPLEPFADNPARSPETVESHRFMNGRRSAQPAGPASPVFPGFSGRTSYRLVSSLNSSLISAYVQPKSAGA